jgi:hypothetical protein
MQRPWLRVHPGIGGLNTHCVHFPVFSTWQVLAKHQYRDN